MFWILLRDHGTMTRFETDREDDAVFMLKEAVLDPATTVVDYSGTLDGSIDDLLRRLDSVKIGYPVAKAA
jgi:hypothetical protein